MSAITPPSFLDDGGSIANRLPQGLDKQRVAKWVSRGTFSDTSAYTGSFVDDDEDIVLRSSSISDRQARHEKEETRKKGDEQVWNENAKKAVSGDVRRHMDKIRDLRGKVQVRKVKKGREMEKEKKKVLVPVPRRWGTFVIKDKDGRVVVVDEEGEFDSGPRKVHNEKQHERRWVRAASTVESSSPFPVAPSTVLPPRDQYMSTRGFAEDAEVAKRRHEKDKWNYIPNSPRPLSPIPESEDEDGSSSTSKASIRSQKGFMAKVTGWKDGSQNSTTGNARSSNGSTNENKGWVSPSKLPHPFACATGRPNSPERWSHGSEAVDNPDWTESETSFQQHGFDGPARSFSEATWDGFERRKTISDVSIAGSNSIRSSLIESVRSYHDTAMSRRRGTSREEIRVENQHGWEDGSNGRSNGGYASSSDEDNATYWNANWGETPARVAKY
ncbi:hypothetical protein yc1106_00205 [Curvularia clavata]|uniref:Uncharacterized protein n=1 Tax=Curvularia clavata TaxID=95742 RepID=A0A9Q8YZJ9_CURCL|nr:hypothetical protein yc1106_00205 [Curvularia clavata]